MKLMYKIQYYLLTVLSILIRFLYFVFSLFIPSIVLGLLFIRWRETVTTGPHLLALVINDLFYGLDHSVGCFFIAYINEMFNPCLFSWKKEIMKCYRQSAARVHKKILPEAKISFLVRFRYCTLRLLYPIVKIFEFFARNYGVSILYVVSVIVVVWYGYDSQKITMRFKVFMSSYIMLLAGMLLVLTLIMQDISPYLTELMNACKKTYQKDTDWLRIKKEHKETQSNISEEKGKAKGQRFAENVIRNQTKIHKVKRKAKVTIKKPKVSMEDKMSLNELLTWGKAHPVRKAIYKRW